MCSKEVAHSRYRVNDVDPLRRGTGDQALHQLFVVLSEVDADVPAHTRADTEREVEEFKNELDKGTNAVDSRVG